MHSLFICLISISDFFLFLVMKMSHKRKILLFKSCLLVTYQPFVFYTYIFLIHKIHHKISTARNPDKHQPVVCERDNFLTDGGSSCETVLEVTPSLSGSSAAALAFLLPPAPSGAAPQVARVGRRSWHLPAPRPCPAPADSAAALASLPGACSGSSARAGRIMDNEELGG